MEIFLLWLDDLDDLAFAVAISWRSICRFGLVLGLPAALILMPGHVADLRAQWMVAPGLVAAVSVLAWLSAAAPILRRSLPRSPSPA